MKKLDLKYAKYFNNEDFRLKLKKTFQKAGSKVVYAALVLYYVLIDKETPKESKIVILSALGYFILPIDLIPDFIPIAGFIDDFGAIILAFTKISSSIKPEHREKALIKCQKLFRDFKQSDTDLLAQGK